MLHRPTYRTKASKCLVEVAEIPPATARCSRKKTTMLCKYARISGLIRTADVRATSASMSFITVSIAMTARTDGGLTSCENIGIGDFVGMNTIDFGRMTDEADAPSSASLTLASASSRLGRPSSAKCLCEMKNWSFYERASDVLLDGVQVKFTKCRMS
jgi:hypothetical protein